MSGSGATLSGASGLGLSLQVLGDERLVRLAAGGSERAFALLYERHHQALYRYCRSIVRDGHDAQDVLQTTMAKALAALRSGPPDSPARPWLFRIAHNESISLLRARKPTVELDHASGLAGRSVEDGAHARERLSMLVADLGDLPERQRSALVLRELSGLSHTEIATVLGVSLSGAKQAIFEARVGLSEFARGREMACAEIQRLISDADGRTLRSRPLRAHLRSCGDCRALRDAIGQRRSDLAAIAPPLPAAAAAGVLARLFGVGARHAGGGGGAAASAATAGKASTVALSGKLAAGAVVLATVGAGAPKVLSGTATHPTPGAGHAQPAARPAPGHAAVRRQAAASQATTQRFAHIFGSSSAGGAGSSSSARPSSSPSAPRQGPRGDRDHARPASDTTASNPAAAHRSVVAAQHDVKRAMSDHPASVGSAVSAQHAAKRPVRRATPITPARPAHPSVSPAPATPNAGDHTPTGPPARPPTPAPTTVPSTHPTPAASPAGNPPAAGGAPAQGRPTSDPRG